MSTNRKNPLLLNSFQNLPRAFGEQFPHVPNRNDASLPRARSICVTTVNRDGTCMYEFQPFDVEAQAKEVAGFEEHTGKDLLFLGLSPKEELPAHDLNACKRHCRDKRFGAFVVGHGTAYFWDRSAEDCAAALCDNAECTAFVDQGLNVGVQDALIQFPCTGEVIAAFVPADSVDPTAIHAKAGDLVRVTKMTNDAAWFYADVLSKQDGRVLKSGLLPRGILGQLTATRPATAETAVTRPSSGILRMAYKGAVLGEDSKQEEQSSITRICDHFKQCFLGSGSEQVEGFKTYSRADIAGQAAEVMPAADLNACASLCRKEGYGAFVVWQGRAYFHDCSAKDCAAALQKSSECTAYVDNKRRTKGDYVEICNDSVITEIGPELQPDEGNYTYCVSATDEKKLKERGLRINPKSGKLCPLERGGKVNIGKNAASANKEEDRLDVAVVLIHKDAQGPVEISRTTLNIRVHNHFWKRMIDKLKVVYWGLLVAFLMALWLRLQFLGNPSEQYHGFFGLMIQALLNGTFWVYCSSFAVCSLLVLAMFCFGRDEERVLHHPCLLGIGAVATAIALFLSVVQFQFYMGDIAYRVPHMVEYKPGPRLSNDSDHFISPCFESQNARCPDDKIKWKADLDDIAWSKDRIFGISKMGQLDLIRANIVTVAAMVFTSVFSIGNKRSLHTARVLLDFPDIDDFWSMMLEEKVLVTFWGKGDENSVGQDQAKKAGDGTVTHDGHFGLYTMPNSETTYSIKDHPDFGEWKWNLTFWIFMIGAIKASILPFIEIIIETFNLIESREAKKAAMSCFEALHTSLDLPFFVVRVLMIQWFNLESSTFLPKNFVFIIISFLRIVTLNKGLKKYIPLPEHTLNFVLSEMTWLESQLTEEDVKSESGTEASGDEVSGDEGVESEPNSWE